MRANKVTAGYKEPSWDYFFDVRRAAAAWLYRKDDEYRRQVETSRTQALKQQEKRRARA